LFSLVTKVVYERKATSQTTIVDFDAILEAVTVRLLALFFAAFDTTALTLSQALLDLMTQDQSIHADIIRTEAQSVLSQNNGSWNLSSLQDLKLLGR
jgi:hypothetical protein